MDNNHSTELDDKQRLGEDGVCASVQELLFDYMSGELGEKQSLFIREHLLHCKECSREAKQIEETVTLLKSAPRVSDAHLSPTVRKRLERAVLYPFFEFVYLHRKATAWTVALLVMVLIFVIAYKCQFKPETVVYWIK